MAFHGDSHLFKWSGLCKSKTPGGKKVCFLKCFGNLSQLFRRFFSEFKFPCCNVSIFTFNWQTSQVLVLDKKLAGRPSVGRDRCLTTTLDYLAQLIVYFFPNKIVQAVAISIIV